MVPMIQGVAAALALILLVAALSKLDGWRRWRRTVARLIPLPGALGLALRVAVPTAELSAAILLLAWPEQGLAWSAILLIVFAVAAAALTIRHGGEECGCFGSASRSRVGWKLVLRNAALAALSVGAAFGAQHVSVPALPGLQLIAILMAGLIALTGIEWWQLHRIRYADIR
jgi:hypothetical protein